MVWKLDMDDFTGQFCGAGKYPLITRLNKALQGKYMRVTRYDCHTVTVTAHAHSKARMHNTHASTHVNSCVVRHYGQHDMLLILAPSLYLYLYLVVWKLWCNNSAWQETNTAYYNCHDDISNKGSRKYR